MQIESQFTSSGISNEIGLFYGVWSQKASEFLDKNKFEKVELDGKWGDFDFFEKYGQSIRSIVVQNSDRLAAGLRHLRHLESLELKYKNKDVFSFGDLPSLNELVFPWSSECVGVSALKHVGVRVLQISNLPIIDESIENDVLESIVLLRPKIEDLSCLTHFSNVRSVEVHRGAQLWSLSGLPMSTNRLRVEFCNRLHDLSALGETHDLEFMSIVNFSGSTVSEEIYNCKSLRRLGLTRVPLSVEWERLFAMPNLEYFLVLHKGPSPSSDQFSSWANQNMRRLDGFSIDGSKSRSLIELKIGS